MLEGHNRTAAQRYACIFAVICVGGSGVNERMFRSPLFTVASLATKFLICSLDQGRPLVKYVYDIYELKRADRGRRRTAPLWPRMAGITAHT